MQVVPNYYSPFFMKKFLYIFTLPLILVGCSNSTVIETDLPTDVQVSNSAEVQTNIVTSFYPLAFMAEQIVGEKATVINLAGAFDVHDYEPSPQDLVKITTADLVIYQGAQLEPWIYDVIPELDVPTLEVTHELGLSTMEESNKHDSEDEHNDHEEEGHDDDEDEHDEHNHGEFDPHTWLDPVLAQQMVDQILTEVIKIDTANEDLYTVNAEILKNRFAKLDQNFITNLGNCSVDEVITSHDAFGYIAKRYNFTIHAIAGLSTQDEPSAKVLANLKKEAAEGVTHILIEKNSIIRYAETLANETGLAVLSVNPLGKGVLDPNKDFFDVMQENLNSFSIALNCQL